MMCGNISRQGVNTVASQALDLSTPPSRQRDQLPLTWMLRNLHRKHTVDSLHAHFQNAGVDSRLYNMLYIPFDNRKKANARYAFINFVNGNAVKQVIGKLHAEFGADPEGKPSVLPANIQGVEASISEYMQRHQGRPSAKQQLLLLYEGHRIGTKTALLLYSNQNNAASMQNWRPGFDATDHQVFSQEKLSMAGYGGALGSPGNSKLDLPEKLSMAGYGGALGSPGNSKLDLLEPETRSSTTASSPYSSVDVRTNKMEHWAATYMEKSAVGKMNAASPMPRTIMQERMADLHNSRTAPHDQLRRTTIDHYPMACTANETPMRSVFLQDRDAVPAGLSPEVFFARGTGPLPSEVPIPGQRLLKTQDHQGGSFMANSRYMSMGYF
jgi:hypothetical protein